MFNGDCNKLEPDVSRISYSYVDEDNTYHTGEWMGDEAVAVKTARDALNAEVEWPNTDSEQWTYRADETGIYWRVWRDDMAALGATLLSGIPLKRAYSVWCIECTSAEEVD